MAVKQDVKLTFIGPNYDISIGVDGDIKTEDSFEASILTSLFTDARADDTEVIEPELRRGWIGSHDQEFKIGSKLWLYSQIRNRVVDQLNIPSEAFNALEHFIDDERATSVKTSIEIIDGRSNLRIDIARLNNKVIVRYYDLWNNTGK